MKSIRQIFSVFILLAALTGAPVHPAAARPMPQAPLAFASPKSLPASVSNGALVWGDFDNNGSLDLLATGMTSSGSSSTGKTAILTYQNGAFTENPAGSQLAQVQSSSAAWGDYDNDGYLDVLLTGLENASGAAFTGVYHNEASGTGRRLVLRQTLQGIYQGSATWGDYNNDGRLDILLTGNMDSGVPFARIYRNTGDFNPGATFDALNTPSVTPVGFSATAWGDFDKDGLFDFVLSGKAAGNIPVTQVYWNRGAGTFQVITLTGVWNGTTNLLDYDLDGYLDLLVTGNKGTNVSPNIQPSTILYHTTLVEKNGEKIPTFTPISGTGLPDIWNSSVSVGDYDNDGDGDLAMSGNTLSASPVNVFINNRNGTFTDSGLGLPSGTGRMLAWGDYNGDRTLDLAYTSAEAGFLYPNSQSATPPPTAPKLRSACWNGTNQLTLNWFPSGGSLSYSVRIGTAPGDQNILDPGSDPATGTRHLAEMGNAFTGTSAMMVGLANQTYYWSVQGVDASYNGGPFDAERVISLGTPVAQNDTYTMYDDEQNKALDVLGNDSKDGSNITIDTFTKPTHGDLTLTNNIFYYTPRAPYGGPDSFTYYAVRDNTLYCSMGTVNITVNQRNDAPTDIALDPSSIPDGLQHDKPVGRFTTTDPDINDTFTYTLLNVNDYQAFRIEDNQLISNVDINGSIKDTYSIRVRTTDHGGLSFEKAFILKVVHDRAPTDINLDPASVLENQPLDTIVGILSTTDLDPGDTSFVYDLVACNDKNYDNDSFYIYPGTTRLRTKAVFEHNKKSDYQVCIRSTDPGGLSFEKVFPIKILPTIPTMYWLDSNNVQQPITVPLPTITMSEDGFDGKGIEDPLRLTVLATDTGIDETLTWSISEQPGHGSATAVGNTETGEQKSIFYTPDLNWNSADGRGSDHFVVRVSDPGGNTADLAVSVYVSAVNDPPTFNKINDMGNMAQLSGKYTVKITGISPGPPDEAGQKVTLSAYGYCKPAICPITAVQPDGTAILTFPAGVGPKTYSIIVRALDGQQFKNSSSRSFNVSFLDGPKLYFPILSK